MKNFSYIPKRTSKRNERRKEIYDTYRKSDVAFSVKTFIDRYPAREGRDKLVSMVRDKCLVNEICSSFSPSFRLLRFVSFAFIFSFVFVLLKII